MKVGKSESKMGSLRIEEKPRTLREMALERMRRAILEFHFKPGQRLVERDLCEQLGVSRSVVREVVRHLESEGLIQTKPHHGPVVAKLDVDTAKQIYELRAVLESAAAEAAAANADPAAIADMETALKEIDAAYGSSNFKKVLSATTSFYEAMFLSGGKSVAWEMVQRLNGRISWLRSMTVASPGRGQSGPTQMREILAAIKNKDGAAASAACRKHLSTAGNIAQALLLEIPKKDSENSL
jgi:DNA-binding GntR family transcriptional regulator